MQQHLKQLMMTLALLVTAAAGAWAENYLYLEIDGTTATLKWGDDYAGKLYFDDGAWRQGGSYAKKSTYNFLTTLSVDTSCQNFTGTILSSLFAEWQALTTINGLGNLNTEMVTNMFGTFQECSALTTVDLSGWNTANVKVMSKMFKGSSKLETIYVGYGWSTAAVTDGDDMFDNCTSLPGFDDNKADVSMAKLTSDGGYLTYKEPTIELTWDAATRTATLDEMPEGNVVVNVEYYSWAGVTLSVTGQTQGGTAKLLKKLDDGSFANMTDQDQVREERKFILMVDREEGYDFKVPDATFEEFTEDEYVEYYNWAKDNDINVPLTSALLWVTMPHVDSGNLNLEVNFQQLMTFTILYQPATGQNPDVVACKIERSVKGTPEVSYMAMRRGATMGDGSTAVWTTTMQAAYGPTQIAFVPVAPGTEDDALEAALNNAGLTNAAISQSANDWTNLSGAQYLIIGGYAKVVTAAFVADANAVTTYKDFQVDEAVPSTGGVTYQLAVCQTDAQGNVTTAGTVKAPAAPAAAQGVTFDGWRGYTYDGNGRLVEKVFAAGETVSLRGNMTFNAIWNPVQIKTTFALNGGKDFSPTETNTTYGNKLSVSGEPKRSGLVFDKWTVTKAVNESGILFGRGSQFDMNTALTADLGLVAQWKHVHEYTCYQISAFGDALKNYQKYNGLLHIAVCGCEDVEIVEHEFNPAGKCACGFQKASEKVQCDIEYGKLDENNNFNLFANGFPEFATRGQEVTIEAFHNWGNLEFKTWQYSTDNGRTWQELAAFEIVGFLIPCNMTVRALYVNPVQTPTIELASSRGEDQTVYQGQTYTMYNILYQMSYKLPDGYKLLDAGIRMGDNAGISYYFEQTQRYSYDAESKGIAAGIGAGVAAVGVVTNVFLGGGFDIIGFTKDYSQAMFNKTEEVVYLEREENVMVQEKMSAATLAKKMYESIPINVKKYDPIYWEANAPTKGNFGSIATMPPLRFAQKNNQDHYIYGIAYMRYETPTGEMKFLYTDAIAPTVNNPNCSTKKEERPSNARLMAPALAASASSAAVPAVSPAGPASASRKAPKREPEQQPERVDLSTVTAPQTHLVVYVDGEFSGQLSDDYGYNQTVKLTAPYVDGKTFSYWTTDDGAVITTAKELTLTMKAHTTLRAVYDAAAVPAASPASITSATRSNDGKSIVLHAIATEPLKGAGFVYSTTATEPTIGADGVTNVAAVLYGSMGSEMPASVIDRNNCWSLQITPGENDTENAIYHVRAYTMDGGSTTYSEVKHVKFSDLKSGLMMVANIAAFDNNAEPNIDELLSELKAAGQLPAGVPVEVPAGQYVTYYSDKALRLSDSAPADTKLYTITDVSGSEAIAAEIPSANAGMPFLIYNGTGETKTFLLTISDDVINQAAAPEFVGTLVETQIAASSGIHCNYAFNGYEFVYVKNALPVAANKAWLATPAGGTRNIRIVFPGDDAAATAVTAVSGFAADDASIYTLDGRRVLNPAKRSAEGRLFPEGLKKGVYVKDGKKVIIK